MSHYPRAQSSTDQSILEHTQQPPMTTRRFANNKSRNTKQKSSNLKLTWHANHGRAKPSSKQSTRNGSPKNTTKTLATKPYSHWSSSISFAMPAETWTTSKSQTSTPKCWSRGTASKHLSQCSHERTNTSVSWNATASRSKQNCASRMQFQLTKLPDNSMLPCVNGMQGCRPTRPSPTSACTFKLNTPRWSNGTGRPPDLSEKASRMW